MEDDDDDFLAAFGAAEFEPLHRQLPHWHRPGPGQGHKAEKEQRAESRRGRQRQAEKMRAARAAKRARDLAQNQSQVVEVAVNSALHARAHVSRARLRRSADGFLSIRGKEGLRFARATVAGKRKRCRSQHKRTIRACCSLLKRRRLAKPTLSSLELVSIAFENINQSTTQAAVWKRPRHRLKEVHAFVAHVFDRVQAGQMQQLKQMLEDDPPDWVVAFRMWDETGERVQVKMPSLTTVSDVWHILVSKLSFSWGWFDNRRLLGTFDLVCPCAPAPQRCMSTVGGAAAQDLKFAHKVWVRQ